MHKADKSAMNLYKYRHILAEVHGWGVAFNYTWCNYAKLYLHKYNLCGKCNLEHTKRVRRFNLAL